MFNTSLKGVIKQACVDSFILSNEGLLSSSSCSSEGYLKGLRNPLSLSNAFRR